MKIKNIIKILAVVTSNCIIGIALLILINRMSHTKTMFIITPNIVKGMTGGTFEELPSVLKVLITLHNNVIGFLSLYPATLMLFLIGIMFSVLLYDIYAYFYEKKRGKLFVFFKTLVTSAAISTILSYYNLFLAKATKFSNDIVIDFKLFKVGLLRSLVEKKIAYYDGFESAVKNTIIIKPDEKKQILDNMAYRKNIEEVLTEEYTNGYTTEQLHNLGIEYGGEIIKKFCNNPHIVTPATPNDSQFFEFVKEALSFIIDLTIANPALMLTLIFGGVWSCLQLYFSIKVTGYISGRLNKLFGLAQSNDEKIDSDSSNISVNEGNNTHNEDVGDQEKLGSLPDNNGICETVAEIDQEYLRERARNVHQALEQMIDAVLQQCEITDDVNHQNENENEEEEIAKMVREHNRCMRLFNFLRINGLVIMLSLTIIGLGIIIWRRMLS